MKKLEDEIRKMRSEGKRGRGRGKEEEERSREPKRGRTERENRVGRAIFSRKDAVDKDGKPVCVNWSTPRGCTTGKTCIFNGKELLHKVGLPQSIPRLLSNTEFLFLLFSVRDSDETVPADPVPGHVAPADEGVPTLPGLRQRQETAT